MNQAKHSGMRLVWTTRFGYWHNNTQFSVTAKCLEQCLDGKALKQSQAGAKRNLLGLFHSD
jgi:hypothetical protein